MKTMLRCLAVALIFVLFGANHPLTVAAQVQPGVVSIDNWEMLWEPKGRNWTVEDVRDSQEWIAAGTSHPLTSTPAGISDGWVRIKLPEMSYRTPGLYFPIIYGNNFEVYLEDRLIHKTFRTTDMERNEIILPLEQSAGGSTLYIRIDGVLDRIGFIRAPQLGEYQPLNHVYLGNNFPDLILAGGFFFVAVMMFVTLLFLRPEQRGIWLSLALVIVSSGFFLISHSRLMHTVYDHYGILLGIFFDLGMMTFTVSLTFFVEQIIQGKLKTIVRIYRKILFGYSCIYFLALLMYLFIDGTHAIYFFIAVTLMSVFLLSQMGLLLTVSIVQACKGNRDALLFSGGVAIFGLLSIIDLVLFVVRDMNYELVFWKWGLTGFIMMLIVLLGRRLANDHARLVQYSKELELFNNQLQHSEKMQIISELAASVAHEVRNPLQVTRGFLQLLNVDTTDKKKRYLNLALDELDRASDIITDFLTFAKPQLDHVTELHLATEMKHIEGVLLPLTNFQGGEIESNIPDNLYIRGNSAKFKQALINIIKNSIEALKGKGLIQITASNVKEDVVIVIRDNGEGMDKATVAKLGQPYFSTKTKGTGLGLMVTFRIIEVMNGTISFSSVLGVGTEVLIKLPCGDFHQPD